MRNAVSQNRSGEITGIACVTSASVFVTEFLSTLRAFFPERGRIASCQETIMDLSDILHLGSRTYAIPGNPATDVYLLPVSGGADSTALAILLHEIAPHIPFRMVFTDTGAEEKDTLDMLDRLEKWLGNPWLHDGIATQSCKSGK